MSCCSNFCSVMTDVHAVVAAARALPTYSSSRSAGEPHPRPGGPVGRLGDAARGRGTRAWGAGAPLDPAARPLGVRDDLEAGPGVPGDDSQQLLPGGPLPTSQAGADRAPDISWGHRRLHVPGGSGRLTTVVQSSGSGAQGRTESGRGESPGPAAGPPAAGRRLVGADVDAPAGQPGGEAGVLALLADRQRQLVVGHDHPGGPGREVDDLDAATPGPATARAPTISAGSSDQSTMSIFSPCSSFITLRTRWPIGPMHEPLALTPGTVVRTAILVRWPASRAIAQISTVPSAISGHLEREQLLDQVGVASATASPAGRACPCAR